MKFALFTGCVAKGATRELMLSTTKAAEGLGFEFVEMNWLGLLFTNSH